MSRDPYAAGYAEIGADPFKAHEIESALRLLDGCRRSYARDGKVAEFEWTCGGLDVLADRLARERAAPDGWNEGSNVR